MTGARRTLYTFPNALSALRGIGIPVFIYFALISDMSSADFWAVGVLAVGGASDYFDGKLARAWNQTSRFGEIADPTIDRLYILATLIVLVKRDALPLWIVIVLLIRDLLLAVVSLILHLKKLPSLTVTFAGKAATFNLMYAFPFLLLALHDSVLGRVSFVLGWSFTWWGIVLYLGTGFTYLRSGWQSTRLAK